jgi:hypothetical protein
MTKLAVALTSVLMLGTTSIGLAGEGSPDRAVPAMTADLGVRTVAPVVNRTRIQRPNATAPERTLHERSGRDQSSY